MIYKVISCDSCFRRVVADKSAANHRIEEELRLDGWSMGKRHLCPDCRPKKKEDRSHE